MSGRSPDPGTSVPARRKPLPRRSEVRWIHGGGVRAGLAMLRPGRRDTGSTIGRTRWRVGRGSNCQTGPDTPRRQEPSSPFPCSAARNVDVTTKVTPYVTPARYGLDYSLVLRFAASCGRHCEGHRTIRRSRMGREFGSLWGMPLERFRGASGRRSTFLP